MYKILAVLGMAAGFAQLAIAELPEGTVRDALVGYPPGVPIPNNTITEIAHIDVDCGYWEISGGGSLYNQFGTRYFYAFATISESFAVAPLNGSVQPQSVQPTYHINDMLALPISTKTWLIRGPGTHRLRLLIWNFGTDEPINSVAIGNIHGVKIDECREVP